MKMKFAVLAMAVALCFIACAQLQQVQDFICNPTPEQQQEAGLAVSAIDALQAVGAIYFPPLALVKASAVFSVIQQGGCFFLHELETAFAALDQATAAKAKATGLPVKAPTNYPNLRKLLAKK